MSKTVTVTLPSRPTLADGTPNPEYDATLDPGSNLWQAQKYFDLQDTVFMHIGADRENPHLNCVGVSINGYRLEWPAESDQMVPRDFAELIVDRRLGYRIG